MNKKTVGIIGTGSYGIALAKVCKSNGYQITMWTKLADEKEEIVKTRENKKVLPGVLIEEDIVITNDLNDLIANNDLLLIALPVPFLEDALKSITVGVYNKTFVVASKGITDDSHLLMHELLQKYLTGFNLAVISGPSFAIDLVKQNPVGLSLYASSEPTYQLVMDALNNHYCKLYRSSDLIGLELAGAIKNVVAIAAGIINGLAFSESTQVFFQCRVLNDIRDIIVLLGGEANTIYELAGIGDLFLTCSSTKSRNYQFGILLAKSYQEASEFLKTHTVEGVATLKSIDYLLKEKKVNNHLITLLRGILNSEIDSYKIIDYLTQ